MSKKSPTPKKKAGKTKRKKATSFREGKGRGYVMDTHLPPPPKQQKPKDDDGSGKK